MSSSLFDQLLTGVDSLQNRAQAAQVLGTLASVLTDEGRFDEAEQAYSDAIAKAEELAKDGENTASQRNLADLCSNLALCYNIQGDYLSADSAYSRASDINRSIASVTGTASDRARLALTLLNLGENAFKAQDYSHSGEYFSEGLQVYEEALPELDSYDRAQYLAWLSYDRLIHERDYSGALNAALEAYSLQPNNVLVNMNLGYACLYNDYYEDADKLLGAVAALGRGQLETIQRDLEAQKQSGLENDHIPELLNLLKQTG